MSQYQPGDVAMVSAANQPKPYRAYYDGKTWREYGNAMFCVDTPLAISTLVVLDPDDSAAMGDLTRSVAKHSWQRYGNAIPAEHELAGVLVAALLDQTKPARIPEPGLFGVVEGWQQNEEPDMNLSAFYLRESLDGEADWTRTSDGKRFEWDDIREPVQHREGVES